MKLYNITFNIKDITNILKPTVPDSVGLGENNTIKRVCLADSVEHCMQAIAVGNRELTSGAKFILKEVTISKRDSALINPEKLYTNKLVPDALENKEYWCLHSIKCNVYLCEITDFDYEFELAWSCIPVEKMKTIIKRHIPAFKMGRYTKSISLYNALCEYINKNHLYDEYDNIWEDLAELPWAQTTKVYNLRYKVLRKI